jgi:hypothetical protein
MDREGYCFCKDEKALLQFAIDGLWSSIEDLEESTGVSRNELISVWFLIVLDRVFIGREKK